MQEKTVCDSMWQCDTPSVMGGVPTPLGIRMHPDDAGYEEEEQDDDDDNDEDGANDYEWRRRL